jgi:hypothetical protein
MKTATRSTAMMTVRIATAADRQSVINSQSGPELQESEGMIKL